MRATTATILVAATPESLDYGEFVQSMVARTSQVWFWASVGAAVAGIAAVAALSRWRSHHVPPETISQIRGIQDVLTDCYRKIKEMERYVAVAPATVTPKDGLELHSSMRAASSEL